MGGGQILSEKNEWVVEILAGALSLDLIGGWFLHERTRSGSVGHRGSTRELSLWSGGVGVFLIPWCHAICGYF